MNRTQWLQETRMRRFEEAYTEWQERRLSQEEAARLLGVTTRTFRRYTHRYEEDGLEGLLDRRSSRPSHRLAPLDEVMELNELYRRSYDGWNVRHFYGFYRGRHDGGRSYTWVKKTLQEARLVARAPGRGKHRKRRERAPVEDMLLHQDGSRHEWVPGTLWDI